MTSLLEGRTFLVKDKQIRYCFREGEFFRNGTPMGGYKVYEYEGILYLKLSVPGYEPAQFFMDVLRADPPEINLFSIGNDEPLLMLGEATMMHIKN